MGFIWLETERLLLRDHRKEDIDTHHTLFSDAEVMYYLQDIMTHSLEESRKNLAEAVEEIQKESRGKYFLRIEEKETGRHVGEIGYTVEEFTPAGKLVGLGYFIRRTFWGKGYTSEAVREMLRFGFEENGVYRVSTGCIADNRGSQRVMQKCGFTKEAEMKDKVWHDGRMKTRVEYRMLLPEWREQRG